VKSKINILFVNYSLDVGGIETLILELSKRLNPSRFKPEICVLSTKGNLGNEFENAGITVHPLNKKEGLGWSIPFKLSRIIKERGIDILHSQNQSSWLYAAIAAKLARIPLVHTVHSNVSFNNPHPHRWLLLQRHLAKHTRLIICVANSNAKFMQEKQHIPAEKIRVVYNGIEPEIYSSAASDPESKKMELGITKGDVIIGNVARFSPPKDHENLIRAFKQVLQSVPAAKLLLIGDGPLEYKIKSLVSKLGLGNQVKFLGRRRDIPGLLKTFDVFVLPSSSEGLPMAILEAMASGLPIIATNVGGNPEVVINEETGIIVPAKNPGALAEATCRLLSNRNEARNMGVRGQNRVKGYFTFEAMAREYAAIYESLLNT
jgi:sugar transferase (PEP-CTERM/EpsH1 system associated)